MARELRDCYDRGKGHAIVVVAEGSNFNATRLAQYFREHEERLGFELRVTILGHSQRGAIARLLTALVGGAAIEHGGEKDRAAPGVEVQHLRGIGRKAEPCSCAQAATSGPPPPAACAPW